MPVAAACREFGVSRFTFYKWAKAYNSKVSRRQNLEKLRNKKRKISRLVGKVPLYIEVEVKKIAASNPSLSKYKIAAELERKFSKRLVGTHGVYNVLKRVGINTLEARRKWREFVLGRKKRILTPEQRLEVINRAADFDITVAQVCRDFGISRYTFYKWRRRWGHKGRNIDALRDKKPRFDRRHLRVKSEAEEAILSIVIKEPSLSKYNLTKELTSRFGFTVSPHGIYNVLQRFGLTRPEQRLAYASSFAPRIPKAVGFVDRIRLVWEQELLSCFFSFLCSRLLFFLVDKLHNITCTPSCHRSYLCRDCLNCRKYFLPLLS